MNTGSILVANRKSRYSRGQASFRIRVYSVLDRIAVKFERSAVATCCQIDRLHENFTILAY